MRMVCSDCDLGLKRSDCTEREYVQCECRRWIAKEIRSGTIYSFLHFLDETLEMIYEDKKDLRNAKLEMIQFLSRGMIE